MTDTISTLAAKLRPHWLRDLSSNITAISAAGTPGVTDHGDLSGLFDDDHPQYLTPVRGDARYLTATRILTAGAGLTGGGDLTADRTFDVGVANTGAAGLTVEADAIRLTSSSSPGAAASILASSSAGLLTLYNGAFTQAASSEATFASGFAGSGWRADYGITTASKASIETDDLTVRGRMRVYELLIQQIRATNGSLFVSSASKVVAVTSTQSNPTWTVNGSQLTFNGSNATFVTILYTISTAAAGDTSRELYHGFLVGDLIRAQQTRWNGSSFAGTILSNMEVTSVANLYTYTGAFLGTDAPATGYDFVRIGSASNTNRQGSVYITSDDSAAPFIDIIDGVYSHAVWNSAAVSRVRVGKLTGISDAAFGGALSGYGLYGNNVYLRGKIVVTSGDLGGLAANDVNANSTTINGSRITTGTVTAAQINVDTLSAISADMGTLTAGAITIGSTNKIWLNDSADGALNIGGSTKASAPFRVTAAGALTATSATVTGSIGATGGGVISGNWYVGYDVSYAGSMYFGSGGKARVGTNGMSLVMENLGSSPTIPTSSSALRWFPDISESYTHTNAKNYSGIIGYKHTGISTIDNIWTAYVGSTDYASYAARVMLQAGHMDGGSSYTDARLEVVREAGSGWRYVAVYGDRLEVNGAIGAATMTAPASVWSGGALIYVNTSNGDLEVLFPNNTRKTLLTN